jgi:hypothetical protein
VSLPCPGGQGYGLTEACSASTMVLPDRHEMEGTVGVPLPCVEVRGSMQVVVVLGGSADNVQCAAALRGGAWQHAGSSGTRGLN